MLRIRVTDEQKRAFEQAAEKDGLDVSGFVRQAAIVKARQAGVKIRRPILRPPQTVHSARCLGYPWGQGGAMEVKAEGTAHMPIIHARRWARVPALCGAPPGSSWATVRAYVTCPECIDGIARRLALRN